MKLHLLIVLLLTIASVKLTESEQGTQISTKVQNTEELLPGYGYHMEDSDMTVAKKDEKFSEEAVEPVAPIADQAVAKPAAAEPKAKAEAPKAKPAAPKAAEPAAAKPTTPAGFKPEWLKLGCTHDALYKSGIPQDQMCNVASAICSGDFANFYELYYCAYGGSLTALLITYLIFIFLIFKWTGIVVDEYVCKGITIMTDTWKLPGAVAAVTLLALANGAGDVITALVSGSSPGGVSYNIGALYGAGLFVAIPVMCVCVLKNKDGIVYEPVIIFRDIGIYIFSTIVTLVFAAFGAIYWWMAVIFLMIYVFLVIAAIVIDKKEMFTAEKWNPKVKEEKVAAGTNLQFLLGGVAKALHNRQSWVATKNHYHKGVAERLADAAKLTSDAWSKKYTTEVDGKKVTEEKPSCMARAFDWIMWCVDQPYVWLCRLTCLPPNREEWVEWKFYAWPFTGVYFMIWCFTGSWGSMVHIEIGLPLCALFLAFFVWKMRAGGLKVLMEEDEKVEGKELAAGDLKKDNDIEQKLVPVKETKKADEAEEEEEEAEICKPNVFNWMAVCMGVVTGLLWTYVLVGLLIDMLNALGVFLNLDATFLGLTILAIGNALPDALTTISLATNPKAVTMAVSGGYAGQIFGLLIGFGLAQLKQTLSLGPQKFNLYDPAAIGDNILDLLVLGVALICLLWTFFWGYFNKFHMNKTFAYVGLGIYGAFFVACFIIAISKAIRTF